MARKEYEEEHDNPDRWVMPYADLSTLLFALFVVMYSASSVNEVKYRILTTSVLKAFGQAAPPAATVGSAAPEPATNNPEARSATSGEAATTAHAALPITPEDMMLQMSKALSNQNAQQETGPGTGRDLIGSPNSGNDTLISTQPPLTLESSGSSQDATQNTVRQEAEETEQIKQQMDGVANDIRSALASMIKGGSVSVTRSNHGVRIEINASVLFSPGGYKLNQESTRALSATAQILAKKPYSIQVDGYTDNIPIKNSIFPSNWELSAARAGAVVRLFTQNGIADARLTASGHSANDAVQSNDTAEGRAKNRRVTVGIMSPHAETKVFKQSDSQPWPEH